MLVDENSGTVLDSTSLLFDHSDWELKSVIITAPVGATIAELVLSVQDNSFAPGTGHYLIDGVSLIGPDLSSQGDFNRDFVVDALDVHQWKMAFGTGAGGDGDGDRDSDGADFLNWQRTLGTSGYEEIEVSTVPEPKLLGLLVIGLAAAVGATHRMLRYTIPLVVSMCMPTLTSSLCAQVWSGGN